MNKRKSTKKSNSNDKRDDDYLSYLSFNFSIFSLFLGISFAYFVYFSHQASELESTISSKIIEINAINRPYPFQFLSITGHKEYYYLRRKEVLLNEFGLVKKILQKPNITDSELASYGRKVQTLITQIAYFFPYKKMLEFNKNGDVTFNPNHYKSIDDSIHVDFLKIQLDEIYDLNYRFTMELKDGKDQIVKAMILAGGFEGEYSKNRVAKYIESLIEYLENHYNLAMPLGLVVKKYEYLQQKLVWWKVAAVSMLLAIILFVGVLLPLMKQKFKKSKRILLSVQFAFILGIIILFYEALYSYSTLQGMGYMNKDVEWEFNNLDRVAAAIRDSKNVLEWSEYNIQLSQYLSDDISLAFEQAGIKFRRVDFGGKPKVFLLDINNGVEIQNLQSVLKILKEVNQLPQYMNYAKYDVRTSVLMGRAITLGGFGYKHYPVKKLTPELLQKLLDSNLRHEMLNELLKPDSNFTQSN